MYRPVGVAPGMGMLAVHDADGAVPFETNSEAGLNAYFTYTVGM